MAQPTEEERERERARQQALRKGTRARITDVTKPDESRATEIYPDAPKKPRRGAGAPPGSKKDSTEDVIDELLTDDPDAISEAPKTPWALYAHFCKVVKTKYPSANLPQAGNPKYLRWGKELLRDFSRVDLYEMIRVLVLDYENIGPSKVFFKYSGRAVPQFDQLYCNAETLLSFVGRGIIAPPAVRYSHYADDYSKRKAAINDIPNAGGDSGKTEVDPFDALRDQIH